MKTLLIDNYDSFSRILFQYLWEVNGVEPLFIHNDEWTLDRIRQEKFDNILISPGPGHPDRVSDFGICSAVLATFIETPILGVCLGHQGIGLMAGAKVVRAPVVRHGKASRILHDGQGLFAGFPQGFLAVRYHSLIIEKDSLPASLIVTATAEEDGQIMGVRMENRPCYGVQFHPESIGTEDGKTLLQNFRNITAQWGTGAKPNFTKPISSMSTSATPTFIKPTATKLSEPLKTEKGASPPWAVLELSWQEPESVFSGLFKASSASFWLDSRVALIPGEPVFTYMGCGSKLFEVQGQAIKIWELGRDVAGLVLKDSVLGDPLEFLKGYLQATEPPTLPALHPYTGKFLGGLVGYFGYEFNQYFEAVSASVEMPEALFLEPDRVLAFDHAAQKVFAFLPTQSGQPMPEAKAWLDDLPLRWNTFPILSLKVAETQAESTENKTLKLPWQLSADKTEYLRRIQSLQSAIFAGETYEACLTNEVFVSAEVDPFWVYRLLRRTNPAPYAAYLHFPQGTILSASPERFLHLDSQGHLSSRPIKGTRRRGQTLAEDAELKVDLSSNLKDQSENLMIVDLVRHDFSKVCSLGSVQVPESRVVETHPTVFQLVSGVSGQLRAGQTACDALKACFPGGSMTGAPKRRTMELLRAEEQRDRGVFSGALGFFGWDGAMDLGMTIRTLVHKKGVYSIGCGGAILAESDPEAEFSEAMLKAFASQRALELAVLGESGGLRVETLDRPNLHD